MNNNRWNKVPNNDMQLLCAQHTMLLHHQFLCAGFFSSGEGDEVDSLR